MHARDNDGRSCLHYAALAKATVAEPLVETFIGGGSEPGGELYVLFLCLYIDF